MADLTTAEVCEALGLSPQTVRNLADAGELRCRRTPGGHRRHLATDVAAFDATRSPAPRAEALRAAVWTAAVLALLDRAEADLAPRSAAGARFRAAAEDMRRP